MPFPFFAAEDDAFMRCAGCLLRQGLVLALARLPWAFLDGTWGCRAVFFLRDLSSSRRPRVDAYFFWRNERQFSAACAHDKQQRMRDLLLAAARLSVGLFGRDLEPWSCVLS